MRRPPAAPNAVAPTPEGDDANWGLLVVEAPSGGTLVLRLVGEVCDLGVVDALASAQVALRRAGGHLRLDDVHPALGELLELSGLGRELGWRPSPASEAENEHPRS